MKLFHYDIADFESDKKHLTTAEYMVAWNKFHKECFKLAQDYVENIRQAQQVASLKAIKEVIS